MSQTQTQIDQSLSTVFGQCESLQQMTCTLGKNRVSLSIAKKTKSIGLSIAQKNPNSSLDTATEQPSSFTPNTFNL